MTDLLVSGDLFGVGLALVPSLLQRNRTASLTTRTPKFSCPTIPRHTLRGREE